MRIFFRFSILGVFPELVTEKFPLAHTRENEKNEMHMIQRSLFHRISITKKIIKTTDYR